MAVFSADDCNRLDFEILAEGGVALYYQHEVLGEDVAWLAVERYEIVQFDEESMDSIEAFHFEFRLKLGLGDDYEPTYDGLRDALTEVEVPADGGFAIVLEAVDQLSIENPGAVHRLCEIFADVSREFLLTGQRFVALLQTDDPQLTIPPYGAREVAWNPRERAPWTRGL
jgi:RNAse (barnase) inhibitor barstar